MLIPQIQNEPEAQIPYQQQPWGMPEPGAPFPSPVPPPLPRSSPIYRGSPKRRGTVRTGALVALTLLLAVIFGVGLFAGWQFRLMLRSIPAIAAAR
jgi:hypothetical protein